MDNFAPTQPMDSHIPLSPRLNSQLRRLVVLVAVSALMLTLVPTAAHAGQTPGEIRNSIERRINDARADRGLRRLRVNDVMQAYAQDHARLLGSKNTLFHDAAFFAESPAGTFWAAENVGYVSRGPSAARRMHRAFMDSYLHRVNILASRATHMGIGVVKANGRVWVVQRFADRR